MPDKAQLLALAERRAMEEEKLAALYFIAAAIAFNAGWPIFGWLMVAKGVLDTLSAVGAWCQKHRARAASETRP